MSDARSGIVYDIEPGHHRDTKCQNVRHAVQGGDHREVSFGAFSRILGAMVDCGELQISRVNPCTVPGGEWKVEGSER